MLKKILNYFRSKNNVTIKGTNNNVTNYKKVSNSKLHISGKDNLLFIGNNSSINNLNIFISGNSNKLHIGNDVFIGGGELWLEDNNLTLIIDDGTYIGNAHIAVTEENGTISIGKNCLIAKDVEIRNGDSHSIVDLSTGNRINKAKDVVIREHVWIGTHARILKGVTVESNAVIANSAVVTKNVPANCVVAGNPAKVIKENVNWTNDR